MTRPLSETPDKTTVLKPDSDMVSIYRPGQDERIAKTLEDTFGGTITDQTARDAAAQASAAAGRAQSKADAAETTAIAAGQKADANEGRLDSNDNNIVTIQNLIKENGNAIITERNQRVSADKGIENEIGVLENLTSEIRLREHTDWTDSATTANAGFIFVTPESVDEEDIPTQNWVVTQALTSGTYQLFMRVPRTEPRSKFRITDGATLLSGLWIEQDVIGNWAYYQWPTPIVISSSTQFKVQISQIDAHTEDRSYHSGPLAQKSVYDQDKSIIKAGDNINISTDDAKNEITITGKSAPYTPPTYGDIFVIPEGIPGRSYPDNLYLHFGTKQTSRFVNRIEVVIGLDTHRFTTIPARVQNGGGYLTIPLSATQRTSLENNTGAEDVDRQIGITIGFSDGDDDESYNAALLVNNPNFGPAGGGFNPANLTELHTIGAINTYTRHLVAYKLKSLDTSGQPVIVAPRDKMWLWRIYARQSSGTQPAIRQQILMPTASIYLSRIRSELKGDSVFVSFTGSFYSDGLELVKGQLIATPSTSTPGARIEVNNTLESALFLGEDNSLWITLGPLSRVEGKIYQVG